MKALPILAAVLGIGVMLALVGYFGAGAVIRSLFAVGGLGFAAICAIHLALMVVMGFAWRVLMPGIPSWVAIWGRLVRDSGSEVLPLSQVGGYVLGARVGRTQRGGRRGIAWRFAGDLSPPGCALAVLRAASGMLDRQRGGGMACLAFRGRTIAAQRRAGAGEHALRGAHIGIRRAER